MVLWFTTTRNGSNMYFLMGLKRWPFPSVEHHPSNGEYVVNHVQESSGLSSCKKQTSTKQWRSQLSRTETLEEVKSNEHFYMNQQK